MKNLMIMGKTARFVLTRRGYFMFLLSVVLIVTGYLLMTGKGNHSGTYYNKDIFSFRRITLAPIVVLAGYTMIIFAIMQGPGESKNRA
jgi:hypothetical protein